MFQPTKKAAEFELHNRLSPVVYGSVTGSIPDKVTGAFYRLANGKTFTLSVKDCQSLPRTPRWAL